MDEKVRKSFRVTQDEYDFLCDALAVYRSSGDMQCRCETDSFIIAVWKEAIGSESE